jgi:exodeoxyribonuclease VII large subunit
VSAVKVVGERKVWSLEEVTEAIAARFADLRSFWVEAEIENLRRAGGQVYFTLRGGDTLDGSMPGTAFTGVRPAPAEGGLVQAYGRVEFWRRRSRVSMRVERLEAVGEGLLRARIAELREALERDGLLRAGRGRSLPAVPRRVGLVTSPDGAAREDFLQNAWARNPRQDVLVVGTPVQGDGAPLRIAQAIRHAACAEGVEVVVVARGGGSLEDLMAFNSEPVCRAIGASPVPVVSAVGHERDRSLCDEVADLPVSTPTAAALAAVPNVEALTVHLDDLREAMGRGLGRAHDTARARLGRRVPRLAGSLERVGARAEARAGASEARMRSALRARAGAAEGSLGERVPRLTRAASARLSAAEAHVERAGGLLAALGPEATVARGYAIVRSAADGSVVTGAVPLRAAGQVEIEMRDGRVAARVEDGR